MPLIVWTERKISPTAAAAPGPVASRSSSSSAWLTAAMCSLLSLRKSCAYWSVSTAASEGRRSAEHALHGFEHAAGLEGLDDERLLAHRAAHEDPRMRIHLADLAHRVDAAHVGHDDVHRHEIGTKLLVLLHGLRSRLRFTDDLESCLSQDVADHGAHEDRVVADENRLAQET